MPSKLVLPDFRVFKKATAIDGRTVVLLQEQDLHVMFTAAMVAAEREQRGMRECNEIISHM